MHLNNKLIIIVGAYSTGQYLAPAFISRGYQCIHIQPGTTISPYFLDSYRPQDFIKNLVWDGDDKKILRELCEFDVKAVIPGSEIAVLLADSLSQKLSLPTTNDPTLSIARRNKYEMQKALECAGIKSIPVFKTNEIDAIFSWLKAQCLDYPIVLKPLSSAGTDGVSICQNQEDVQLAFNQLIGTVNALGENNDELLVQPYLHGTEYVVNTVSHDGKHYITDMIRVNKITINASPVYDYAELLSTSEHQELYKVLADYVKKSLDALGIKFGAGHSEVMLVNDKTPVLIETAARPIGGIDLSAYTEALGYNHISMIVESYLNPDHFHKVLRPGNKLPLCKRLLCTFMISPIKGVICNQPDLVSVKSLPYFHSVFMKTQGVLEQTSTLINCPGFVNSLGMNREKLMRQHQKIRQYELSLFSKMVDSKLGVKGERCEQPMMS
ncbi:TPA: ATP-grasp domain-containing protein [Legionella pneumophila]|uniref:ATP-grasp domain-containing protein n=1 Tax=Legionella sp. PATHC039 TaxID=2992042 RepID=UPI001A1E907E|nr:ATP-grasp domain-containing protein [Legionella sp. PATHC039]HAT7072517.1 ATP-grasp domain-containing protein [Legionella pneumophila]HAT8859562.1 ATP-grasp domain-containing protein [Legionella pneumophila subsp. pneumophila]MCW8395715.1 ATP-grasp domain-containing protein [Legionella sp. PATHC039]HAT9650175.1 ATP-grasp domain-containing protein [Legionella pneumophila subsp. pneumophila]HAT9920674.1 ATP-grasp domain-containing protein [Legionella pneumophila subsp. pneumophila]